MNTNERLNCYFFSNLIISVLSICMLVNDSSSTLTYVQDKTGNTLNKIYEKEVVTEVVPLENEVLNDVTSITVTPKDVQSQNTKPITYIKPSYNSVTGSSLVNYAKHYLGLRYVSGGNSLITGTDCSGFTKLIFKEFGINIGRTVSSQIYSGTYVSKDDLKPGDLVFYGHTSSKATHVGIYIGSGLVIHESKPGDVVKINSVNMMVYITARRLITADIEKVVTIKPETDEVLEKEEIKEEIKVEDNKKEESQESSSNTESNKETSNKDEVSDTKENLETEEPINKDPNDKPTTEDKKEESSLDTPKEDSSKLETKKNEVKEEINKSNESLQEAVPKKKEISNSSSQVEVQQEVSKDSLSSSDKKEELEEIQK